MSTHNNSDDVAIVRNSGSDDQSVPEITYEKQTPSGKVTFHYKRPYIIELELTWQCNLKCWHCYANATEEAAPDEMTYEEVKAVIDDCVDLGILELSLTGGEVLLCDHFFKTLEYGQKKGMGLRFVTNGTLLTDSVIEKLRKYDIKLVTVSLDAFHEATHNSIRGCDCFQRTIDGISRLREAGFKVSIISAFSKDNFPYFDQTLQYCRDIQADWQVQITSKKGRCSGERLLSADEYYELGEKIALAMTQEQRIHIIPMDDLATFSRFYPLSLLSSTWQEGCSGGKLNIFVRADGSVTPCSAISFEPFIVGNIRTDGLKSICLNEKCRPALKDWLTPDLLQGTCRQCPNADRCRGGCPEILCTMCKDRHENVYCYWKIEEDRIREEMKDIWETGNTP